MHMKNETFLVGKLLLDNSQMSPILIVETVKPEQHHPKFKMYWDRNLDTGTMFF